MINITDVEAIQIIAEKLMGWTPDQVPYGWDPFHNQDDYDQIKKRIPYHRALTAHIQRIIMDQNALELPLKMNHEWILIIAEFLKR